MAFYITSAKFTGGPGSSGWAQIHEFKPEDEEKLTLRGHLVVVICVASGERKEDIDWTIRGREIISRLQEEYFGDTEKTAFNALKDSIEKVTSEFTKLGDKIEITAVSLVGGVIYIAASGGSKIVLFRNGSLVRLLESTKETISASGHPEDSDMLMLGTSLFFEALTEGQLAAALEGGNPAETIEKLIPVIQKIENGTKLGLTAIKFSKDEPVEKIEIEERGSGEDRVTKIKFPKRNLGGLTKTFEKLIPKKKLFVRRKIVGLDEPKKKKSASLVATLLLVLLFVSIGFGVKQKNSTEIKGRYEDRLNTAKHEMEEAESLFTLNPERARELLESSRIIISELISEGIDDPELIELERLLGTKKEKILGEYESTTELFIDLALFREGFAADSMVFTSSETLYVLDKQAKRVVGVSVDTKETKAVGGIKEADGEIGSIAAYEERIFVLTEDGLFEEGKRVEVVADTETEGEVLVGAYAGNLYLLKKDLSEVYRFPGISGGGFSTKQSWLAPGATPDLANIIDWAFDGSIWLLSSSGKIFQFVRGNQENVSFTNIGPPLIAPDLIYTNEELVNLYVLDKNNNRVVVFDKDGNYKAQYIVDKFAEARGLAVSEKEKKIIILTSDKLLSVGMR